MSSLPASPKLGLGNSVREDTEVLHTSILGKRAFGRITDLILAWAEKGFNLPSAEATSIRLLAQAAMEFAHADDKQEMGQLEFAVEDEKRFISVRFPSHYAGEPEHFEKEITSFWMKEDKAKILKKNLGPHDRVEVRLHVLLNLIEWRVIHRVGALEIELKDSSFVVFVDGTEKVGSFHKKYTDLGDLPFDRLLAEVYKSSETNKQKSGELFYKGQSLQREEEMARVIFEKEQMEIEDDIRIFGGKVALDQQGDTQIAEFFSDEENAEIAKLTDQHLDNTINQLKFDHSESKDQIKNLVKESKQKELQSQRKLITFQQKIVKLEELLKRKELANVRVQNQIKILNSKLSDLQSKGGGSDNNAKAFRDKALQMQAMLIKTKEENSTLEKLVLEMRNREKNLESQNEADQILARSSSVNHVQLEEVSKKADRLHRALDAEKLKVKQLSERVMVAEKEGLMAGPIIEDLERKVEQASKLSQLHKKETETVKQKLIQADAEKNKVQNELMKARAEIQTLLKRQAG